MLLQDSLVIDVAFNYNKIKQDHVCQSLKVNEVFEKIEMCSCASSFPRLPCSTCVFSSH
jgi:hypothetical protein